MKSLVLNQDRLSLADASDFVFQREKFSEIELDPSLWKKVNAAESHLSKWIESRWPIYGVTTGFGDSCARFVDPNNAEALQANLISYLLCGTGPALPVDACRAMFLFRMKSLSRGFSGVSRELLERMQLYLNKDWIPVVPREGSLGASGDLIPLAYLAQALRGQGRVHVNGEIRTTESVLKDAGVAPYVLKAKEGLALVNGTSAMAGLYFANLKSARRLTDLAALSSSWLVLALRGRTEAFGPLVNEQANQHSGQARMARQIFTLLRDEKYECKPVGQIGIRNQNIEDRVQDRYSLRCAPQILGPIAETLDLAESWLFNEVNGTSDNPLIGDQGELGMGGNFYGGYLSHGMDYVKICMAQVADMLDRQLATLIDDKANGGLPPNLANWPGLPENQRHLHHGLKALHQSMSAITSEIMSRAMPNGVFSRSSESHNQDKVSLGMTAAVHAHQLIEQSFTVQSLYLTCLAQALDLRGVRLMGPTSSAVYRTIRNCVPFVSLDQPLDTQVESLKSSLREMTMEVSCNIEK